MTLSDNGLQLLGEWEGLRQRLYRDAAGKLTIGYGHLLTKEELIGGKWNDGISLSDAIELLAKDVMSAEKCVDSNVKVTLQQHEFDALVCFTFNVGTGAFRSSTLLKKLNGGRYEEVPTELRKWVRAGGKRVQGLANRREKEIQLWSGNL